MSLLAAAEDSVVALEEAAAVLSSFFAQALARAMTPASSTSRAAGLILLISNMFAVLPEKRFGQQTLPLEI
ncbi:MAG: hypothetical protein JJ693_02805 [Acidithiobacillus sp.]|nr:hypothetical protein [Acidithiobacillus sp.]